MPSGPRSIAAVSGIKKLSPDELSALYDAAIWISIEPDWLAAIISFETGGSFSPAQKSASSSAVGLIQFMPLTAKMLHTTSDALAAMSFVQQLEYVKKYFSSVRGKLANLDDAYMQVFAPIGVGKDPEFVLYKAPSTNYTANIGLDKSSPKKGYITKADAAGAVRARLAAAGDSRIQVPEGEIAPPIVPIAPPASLPWKEISVYMAGFAAGTAVILYWPEISSALRRSVKRSPLRSLTTR